MTNALRCKTTINVRPFGGAAFIHPTRGTRARIRSTHGHATSCSSDLVLQIRFDLRVHVRKGKPGLDALPLVMTNIQFTHPRSAFLAMDTRGRFSWEADAHRIAYSTVTKWARVHPRARSCVRVWLAYYLLATTFHTTRHFGNMQLQLSSGNQSEPNRRHNSEWHSPPLPLQRSRGKPSPPRARATNIRPHWQQGPQGPTQPSHTTVLTK